jgi:hypothetical protein
MSRDMRAVFGHVRPYVAGYVAVIREMPDYR